MYLDDCQVIFKTYYKFIRIIINNMNIKIRKEYKEILHKIEHIFINSDTTKADNLMKIINMSELKDKFNCIDYWNNFKPNDKKPYSILNTDASQEGVGIHWVGVFQYMKTIYIYDSFGRKNIMFRFCKDMKNQGFKCIYVNKQGDQSNTQINCGIRSLLWLLFVDKYGIKEASKI